MDLGLEGKEIITVGEQAGLKLRIGEFEAASRPLGAKYAQSAAFSIQKLLPDTHFRFGEAQNALYR